SIARQITSKIGNAQKNDGAPSKWLDALVQDLQQHRGSSIVIAGEWQPPTVHALAHSLNEKLENVSKTIFYAQSAEAHPVNQLESLRELMDEMNRGAVKTLFILGGNPAYAEPADLEFSRQLAKVKRSIHLGLEIDETA